MVFGLIARDGVYFAQSLVGLVFGMVGAVVQNTVGGANGRIDRAGGHPGRISS